jgi:acetoin utilization deacetylase AcuC-like enzyme
VCWQGLLSNAESCGFCILNTVAVAACHALATHPKAGPRAVRRVAIVDIDVHHGNGTEDIIRALDRRVTTLKLSSRHMTLT